MTSIEIVSSPLQKRIPYGVKVRAIACGDCTVGVRIAMAFGKGDIQVETLYGPLGEPLRKTFKGQNLKLSESGGWMNSDDYSPAEPGQYTIMAIPVCFPTGYGNEVKERFNVTKREVKIFPELSFKSLMDFIDIKTGIPVGDVIPIKGSVKLTELLTSWIAFANPSLKDLDITITVYRDNAFIESFTIKTDALGGFNYPYRVETAGRYKFSILVTEGTYTSSDSYDIAGTVTRISTAIVAENLLAGFLKPLGNPFFKAKDTISITGRLVYGRFDYGGSLETITGGVINQPITIIANDNVLGETMTNKNGNFKFEITGSELAEILGFDLNKAFEDRSVKFNAKFEGDPMFKASEGTTGVYLRGVYISHTVNVSETQKLLGRIKYGEKIKIEGLLMKTNLGVDSAEIDIEIRSPDDIVVLTKKTKTNSVGIYQTDFSIDGAPVGADGTYTINASYYDPDFGVTAKATDSIDLEKWNTEVSLLDTFLVKISNKKLYFNQENVINGRVQYLEKTGGPIGIKVQLYDTMLGERQDIIDRIVNTIKEKGAEVSESYREEIRAVLDYLAKQPAITETKTTINGAFSLLWTPKAPSLTTGVSAPGKPLADISEKYTLIISAEEDHLRYGSFVMFSVEVGPPIALITLAANPRSVPVIGGSSTLTGKMTLKDSPNKPVVGAIEVWSQKSPSDMTYTKIIDRIDVHSNGEYQSILAGLKPGFYAIYSYHSRTYDCDEASSVPVTVAFYEMTAEGKWRCPYDGLEFETEIDLIEHLKKHHDIHDNFVKGECPYWRPYKFGSLVRYGWCRTKKRLGLE